MSSPFLNKDEEIIINASGFLPHWNQNSKIQFVTFRLIDSLPQTKLIELSKLKEQFLLKHPLPWNNETRIEYWKIIGPFESKLLDKGYGSCILKDITYRNILSGCLRFFDNKKYELIAYVIMPNHVHILMRLFDSEKIENIMHSIKSFSSKKIKNALGCSGSIWMKEYFDRIVRNQQHLDSCISYIISNPRHLNPVEYELYINTSYLGRQDAATP